MLPFKYLSCWYTRHRQEPMEVIRRDEDAETQARMYLVSDKHAWGENKSCVNFCTSHNPKHRRCSGSRPEKYGHRQYDIAYRSLKIPPCVFRYDRNPPWIIAWILPSTENKFETFHSTLFLQCNLKHHAYYPGFQTPNMFSSITDWPIIWGFRLFMQSEWYICLLTVSTAAGEEKI